jgi:polysaccharide export outer membrane protein
MSNRIAMLVIVCAASAMPLAAQDMAAQKPQAQSPIPAMASDTASKAPAAAPASDTNYVIGAQDMLDISVWKEPEVSRVVPVRPDGKISLPLLNDVQAAGLTPGQLAAQITDSLKKYVTNPQVTVIVTTINSQRIYILGEVTRPGAFPLLPSMTVLQALSSAGGFTQFAKEKNIYVLRAEAGKQVKHPFNYKKVVQGTATDQNIVLKAGDQIVVP